VSVGDLSVEAARFAWSMTPSRAELAHVALSLYDGTASLSADIPWDSLELSRVEGVFRNLNAAELVAAAEMPMPARLAGPVSGDFRFHGLPGSESAEGVVNFSGGSAEFQDVALQALTGQVTYRANLVQGTMAGDLLGGQVVLRASAQLSDDSWQPGEPQSRLQATNVRLDDLLQWLDSPPYVRRFAGRGDAQLDLTWDNRAARPTGSGTLLVRDLQWNDRALANELRGRISLESRALHLQDVSTRIAGGTARLDAALDLDQPNRGQFTLDLQRLSAENVWQLVGRETIWPPLQDLSGPVSLFARGQLGPAMSGTGQVTLHTTQWQDVDLQNVRAPFSWSLDPALAHGRASVRLSSARIADGNLRGHLDVRWGVGLNLKCQAQFSSVQIRPFIRLVPSMRDLIAGQLDGRIDLEGQHVRGIEDLTGQYDLRLRNAPSLAFPVLESLTSSLGVGSPLSDPFRTTEAEGRFRRGVLHVDRLTLERPEQRVWIEGRVQPAGRLDLNVTADTRQLQATAALLGLIQPTQLLQQRLLFLHIGGTIRNPIVRPRTFELLQQEVLLFLLPQLPQNAAPP
jgi:hypothetical protein